jgi:replication factor C large subunit
LADSWTTKYRPKHLKDVVGNRKAREDFLKWIQECLKNGKGKKAVLLYGPAGTGKTVTVESAANDLNLELVEINASDKRSSQIIERIVGSAASQSTLHGLNRIILLDEVDGINLREDRGAVPSIIRIIKASIHPIVMTANDPWDPKIRPVRQVCLLIKFRRLSARECLPYLKSICELEGVEAEEEALKIIVERNRGDIRSVINDLEMLCLGRSELRQEDVALLAWRDRQKNIFEALQELFHSYDVESARRTVDLVDMDFEMLFEWIYENVLYQLKDPGDIAEAMKSLAKAQHFISRIKRSQSWNLLPYALELMTGGIAFEKRRSAGYVQIKFPERIKYLSSTLRIRASLNELAKTLGKYCHMSAKKAKTECLPYLRFIFKNNPQEGSRIAEELSLSEDLTELLSR